MTITTAAVPEQGQLVQVRSRPWVVNVVKLSSLPTPAMKSPLGGTQNLLTLSSVEDDGLGEELQVVWEIEPGAKIVEKVALPEPSGFDAPDKLDAFLDAVRWGAASTADVKNIQSPFRSGIEIEDYQLDPVVRAIQMPRVNLLIADDVGVGNHGNFDLPTWGGIAGLTGLGGLILATVLTDGDRGARDFDETPPVQVSVAPTLGGASLSFDGTF